MPFLSVTGSDFMEMFVGVGASRVRDLFQTARKMGRAIIFVDEIDSIGRKRGAGLGGGHDEREQTLNQMLAEMDGFEVTTGIVMMAATNRPDILDPALLRPGRFDRQVVVPLPELDDRRQILEVHVKHKRMAPDVDLDLVARGTPGMSGADLSTSSTRPPCSPCATAAPRSTSAHFEDARDRVLMGQRRESMVLSDREKEAIAYHEAGHAVCAAVLPTADPLHKVTIIPSGMALGVTSSSPTEERHIYRQDYIEDSLVVRMGGRIAEELVFGVVSTGANNDLVGRHRAGPQDGARVGHEHPRRPDGLGLAGPGVPRRGPHAHPRLLRRHRPGHRRGGRAHPPRGRGALPQRRSPRTATASTSSPGRCSSTRPSTAPRSPASSSWPGRAPPRPTPTAWPP